MGNFMARRAQQLGHQPAERPVSQKQLAEHLGVTPRTIYNWEREPDFPKPLRHKRTVRYVLSEVEAWLRQH